MTADEITYPVYYVPIPINIKGQGPEMNPKKQVSVIHEIWDQNNLSIASVCDQVLALRICDLLNGKYKEARRAETKKIDDDLCGPSNFEA